LEKELDAAHKMIDSLDQMIREKEGSASGWGADQEAEEDHSEEVKELEEKLRHLEIQFEQEKLEQNRLAKEFAATERKLAEQEELLRQAREEKPVAPTVVAEKEGGGETSSQPSRSLPHELRPAPEKGAFFRPDWDLDGLPCKSGKDVLKVWETVFNVQISIEGYPSQYCMAFLVVLRKGKQKKVYLMYRLKLNKHTLVCVPAAPPKDEKSLQKAIDEGLKFLRLSGFEMEELDREHIDGALQSYFVEKD